MSSVLTQISVVTIGYGVLVALVSGYAVWRWRARPPWLVQLLWMLEFLLAVRAVAGLGRVLAGDQPAEPGTHLGYLAASVCIVPLAVRSVGDDDSAWGVGVLAVAAVAVTVISWRLVATL